MYNETQAERQPLTVNTTSATSAESETRTMSTKKTTAAASDDNGKTLEALLNASNGETFELASGKVTRGSIAAAETVADRASLYSAKIQQAAVATTAENIATASGNRTRSVIATTRGLCGLVMSKNEAPQAAALRLLFGNGRTHFSSFLKLPKLQIKQLPAAYAAANCVDADGALASHGTAETVPVLFATR